MRFLNLKKKSVYRPVALWAILNVALFAFTAFTNVSATELSSTDPAPWIQAGFLNPKIQIINPVVKPLEGIPLTHEFSMTAIVLRDSLWSVPEVSTRLNRVAQMYAQCGLKLDTLKIVEVTPPASLELTKVVTAENATKLAEITPTPITKPLMYFIKYLRTDPESTPPAVSLGVKEDIRPALQNTSYISSEAKRATFERRARRFGASIEGHELGHVLTNGGHWDDGKDNFLSGKQDAVNGLILPEQCKIILANPMVHPILNP